MEMDGWGGVAFLWETARGSRNWGVARERKTTQAVQKKQETSSSFIGGSIKKMPSRKGGANFLGPGGVFRGMTVLSERW